MSARYFVATDGYDEHLWRQVGDALPVVVTDPVEAWTAGVARGKREMETARPPLSPIDPTAYDWPDLAHTIADDDRARVEERAREWWANE